MVSGAPGVPGRLEPFGRPQLKRLLPGAVSGAQLDAQDLAHQTVVPEGGPLIVKGHQEQMRGINGAQQRRRVLPSGDRSARVRGQHPYQDGGVEHELGHLGRLLVEDLGDEVRRDRMAADIQHPGQPRRIRGAPQGQRRHLQDRGPPLASLMEQGEVSIGDPDIEVRQQVTALGQGEIQVTVAQLAQLTSHPQPVQPQRRIGAACQHQLGDLGRPALD